MSGPVIAVDGPSAAGKGTLARALAAALGLPYLDTGLLYRAVARKLQEEGGDPTAAEAAADAARRLQPADLARDDLRAASMDRAASQVAALGEVRAALLGFQRDFAARAGAVLDGRDIGTVIFPEATLKLFITASPEERALRRWRERVARGEPVTLAAVAADLAERDARDAARAAAPLRPAADAVVIDTTHLDAPAALAAAMAIAARRLDGSQLLTSPA